MEIKFEDFLKVEIRCGLIEKSERVPKSHKLLRLDVNFGTLGSRVVLAGIGKDYSPEDVVGVSALFVTNLEPREMMGTYSHGMILAAPTVTGKLSISNCPGVQPGTLIG